MGNLFMKGFTIKYRLVSVILSVCAVTHSFSQISGDAGAMVIARVKYRGGGDWYNDPSAVPNLCRFIRSNTGISIEEREDQISLLDETLFSYPILFLTGHGKITLSEEEAVRLRNYLIHGGFLYADDDYGMDVHFRAVMKQVFPDRQLVELPFSHDIYHCHFSFSGGLPKIHEHDNNPPQGFAILDDDSIVMVFYSFESNIWAGWADPQVHQDGEDVREKALKMGTNIIL